MGLLGEKGPVLAKRSNKEDDNMDALDVFMNSIPRYKESESNISKDYTSIRQPVSDVEEKAEEEKKIEETSDILDDVEHIDDSSVEIFDTNIDEDETGEIIKGLNIDSVVPDDMEFGSNAVARALGVTTQSIRNYCNTYAKFLDIETTKSGTRRYRMKDIRKLHRIISIKNDRGYTTQQMLSFLENDGKEEIIVTDAERMKALADSVADKVFEKLFDYIQSAGMLEQLSEKEKAIMVQQKEMINAVNHVENLNEEINKKLAKLDLIEKEKQLNEKNFEEYIKKSEELLNEKEQYICELEEVIKQSKKKKWSLFKN